MANTKNKPDRPPLKIDALRRTQELDRIIKAAYAEQRKLADAANQQHGLKGLKALARCGAQFDVQALNAQCITGTMMVPKGVNEYDLAKEFGIEHYHGANHFEAEGFNISFSANDGKLDLFVGLPDAPKQPQETACGAMKRMLPEHLATFSEFFAKTGIRIATATATHKRTNLMEDVRMLDLFIDAATYFHHNKHEN